MFNPQGEEIDVYHVEVNCTVCGKQIGYGMLSFDPLLSKTVSLCEEDMRYYEVFVDTKKKTVADKKFESLVKDLNI